MRAVVFAGPSLPREAAPAVPGLEWRPPVRQGDVYRAALSRPDIIAIVDGYFEVTPTVWHKEILWAMAQGIHVYGAASIGALRAAELDVFGMKGVGRIYEMYRDSVLEDDDEVAVLHGPEELGYPQLSEAMVNIRATLERAVAMVIIDAAGAQALIRAAKSLFYKTRSYERLLSTATSGGVGVAALNRLAAFLNDGRVDQKRLDSLALLDALQDGIAVHLNPVQPSFRLARTTAWVAAVHGEREADGI
jgi:hypothetical protein